jgi:ATP-dependent RNA helicase SUPV3L1/SUV3
MADSNVSPAPAEGEAAETVVMDAQPAAVDEDASDQIAGPDLESHTPQPDAAAQDHGDRQADPDIAPTALAEAATEAVAPVAVEEEKPILLWRPGRPEGRGRHQPRRGNQQRPAAEAGQERRPGRPDFRRNKGEGQPAPGGDRGERRFGKGGERNDRRPGKGGERTDRNAAGERPDRRNDQQARPKREERPQRLDPDSPFAKLAALRDQLRKP